MSDAARAIDFLNTPHHDLGDGDKIAIHHCDIKTRQHHADWGFGRRGRFWCLAYLGFRRQPDPSHGHGRDRRLRGARELRQPNRSHFGSILVGYYLLRVTNGKLPFLTKRQLKSSLRNETARSTFPGFPSPSSRSCAKRPRSIRAIVFHRRRASWKPFGIHERLPCSHYLQENAVGKASLVRWPGWCSWRESHWDGNTSIGNGEPTDTAATRKVVGRIDAIAP